MILENYVINIISKLIGQIDKKGENKICMIIMKNRLTMNQV